MKLNMMSYASVREAIDAINGMTDDMGPFGLVTMGMDDEEGAGVNVEEGMGPEIGAETAMPDMADVVEYYPEEEVYT